MSKPIYLTDRTSEETDELCGMKYWWYRCEGERGIVPSDTPSYFTDGRVLHSDMEHFAKGLRTEQVLEQIPTPEATDQISLEKYYRRLGWAAAWGEFVEPMLRERFEEVSCESELVLDRNPLWVGVIPDRVQRRLTDKKLIYREWKSTSTTRGEWQQHWEYAMQIHIGLMALKEELKEEPGYGQVTGFYKGVERGGRLVHPYVWAYFRAGEWSCDYKAGWEHRPVWEFPGGILEWVRRAGKETADQQFVWTAPIFLNHRRVEEWARTRVARHREIEEVKERARTDLDFRREHFRPASIHCRPAYGEPCPMLAACNNYAVQEAPLKSGLYTPRVPHHDLEIVGVK